MKFLWPVVYLWALPTTVVGLVVAGLTLLSGGRAAVVDGVLEVHGGICGFYLERVVGIVLKGGASAMTLGHVVLGRDAECLEFTREHERVHVRQCERWGPFFIPAYLLASLVAMVRGKRAYRDNFFERQAFFESGG
jgi:hypothetical protein